MGPRYIKGDGRFYSFNVMDLYSHRVYLEAQRTKTDEHIASSLMRCWKTVGIPAFLQLDNELSFRGSNRYPRSFGLVIRLCLFFDVTPVFIPIGEPWRNAVIEHFNDTYNRKFFRAQRFPNFAAVKREGKRFQGFHNAHHRYSCLKGKTPMELIQQTDNDPVTLEPNIQLPRLDYVPHGEIILIRFIRSDRKLNLFGEIFKVSKDLVYSYVKAVIRTKTQTLELYLNDEQVDAFQYRLTARIIRNNLAGNLCPDIWHC